MTSAAAAADARSSITERSRRNPVPPGRRSGDRGIPTRTRADYDCHAEPDGGSYFYQPAYSKRNERRRRARGGGEPHPERPGGEVVSEATAAEAGFFARVPDAVVALGAGSLAISGLLTLAATAFAGYSVSTGQWRGFRPPCWSR
ncbi:hypothetical protein ACFQJD_17585 [Haloplanus sp. GCM10025708]|uniref:hypothetical protein n=1 Tax=Haloplanus sp. GCM10025708 TaxID=3252679 RepID=UPI00360904ED